MLCYHRVFCVLPSKWYTAIRRCPMSCNFSALSEISCVLTSSLLRGVGNWRIFFSYHVLTPSSLNLPHSSSIQNLLQWTLKFILALKNSFGWLLFFRQNVKSICISGALALRGSSVILPKSKWSTYGKIETTQWLEKSTFF